MSEGGNFFKGSYADEYKKIREIRLGSPVAKAEIKRFLESGDQIEFSLEEQIERAEWELNLAQTNLFKLQARIMKKKDPQHKPMKEIIKQNIEKYKGVLEELARRDSEKRVDEALQQGMKEFKTTLKALADHDSGVSEIDQTPGRDLEDYTDKHGN